MIIKKYVFCEEDSRKNLYQRTDGTVTSQNITLEAGQKVSFDTQFHMFPAGKWLEETTCKNVAWQIQAKGKAVFTLFSLKESGEKPDVIWQKEWASEAGEEFLTDDIFLENDKEFLYLSIAAVEHTVIHRIALVSSQEPQREIRLACGICTFKREAECIRNVRALQTGILSNPKSFLYQHCDIYVADNGKTLSGNSLFQEENIFLFENKNYGGAAGFTRCMIEACIHRKEKGYTHMLLMDDDALIMPSVVEDTAVYLAYLKPAYRDYLVGGILMDLENPTIQMERGGTYSADGLTLNRLGVDLSKVEEVTENEKKSSVNYNGWFYACIPAQVIREDNLPLPFFIHGDDIEYGLRFEGKVLTKNDLAIWHPNPGKGSNAREYMRYYDTRNFMVIDALYFPEDFANRQKSKLNYRMLSSILPLRYKEGEFLLRGAEDFLKGPKMLMETEAEALNREILELNKKENFSLEEDENGKAEGILCMAQNSQVVPGWGKRSLLNYLLPFGNKEIQVEKDFDLTHVDLLGVKVIKMADLQTKTYTVRKRSLSIAWKQWGRLRQLQKKIGKKCVTEYQEQADKMRSYAFWSQYLDIEK